MSKPSKQKKTFAALDKKFELMQRFIRVKRQYEPEITSEQGRAFFVSSIKQSWHNPYPFEKEEKIIIQMWDMAWEKVIKAPATN